MVAWVLPQVEGSPVQPAPPPAFPPRPARPASELLPRARPMARRRNRARILPLGDAALTVDFGDAIDPEHNRAVLALEQAVAAAELPGVRETVPSYRALLVLYDPEQIGFATLAAQLDALLRSAGAETQTGGTRWTVPVAYDPPFGLDLPELVRLLDLPPEQIRARHAGAGYCVFMVGFAPGFTYLGGLDPTLTVPRRATPRAEVPAGSIMIGGQQAAIVSMPIPTGWYVLGRTPLRAFEPDRPDPFLFRPGDRVHFRPVGAEEYARLAALPDAELRALAQETAA